MDNRFEVIEKAFGPVIEIEERQPMWRMPATFGKDYKRIADYLSSQGAECAGMPYARYLEMEWEREIGKGKFAALLDMLMRKWHFQVGMPSSKPLSGEGELVSRDLPLRRYAKAIHIGPYKDVGPVYAALYQWVREQGLSLQDEGIECYLNDPQEVTPAELETLILIPIKG